jgi:hypothetical protein
MMTMVIMMIKNWLHFGYSDSDTQEERFGVHFGLSRAAA